jgi:DnaK suppressor protein
MKSERWSGGNLAGNGEMMTVDEELIEKMKAQLLQSRDELLSLQTERDASSATVKLDQSSVGRLSRMDALQQQAMAQDNQRRAKQSLLRIEAALQRCADGSYGYCIDCDEPINPRRLALDPAALLCVGCAANRGQ